MSSRFLPLPLPLPLLLWLFGERAAATEQKWAQPAHFGSINFSRVSHNVRTVAVVVAAAAVRRVYGVTSQLAAAARSQVATSFHRFLLARIACFPAAFPALVLPSSLASASLSRFLSLANSLWPVAVILPALTNKLSRNCLALGNTERCSSNSGYSCRYIRRCRSSLLIQLQTLCRCYYSIISSWHRLSPLAIRLPPAASLVCFICI